MQVKISFTLEMNAKQRADWANEYGLDMSEVDADAAGHLGELVQAAVKQMPHVEQFTTVKKFTVK